MTETKLLPDKLPFAKYFRSVEGHLVGRYGSWPRTNLGAHFVREEITVEDGTKREVRKTVWTDRVIPMMPAEYNRFRREYDQAVAAGTLIDLGKDGEKAYRAWIQAEHVAEMKKAAELAAAPKTDAPPSADGMSDESDEQAEG